MRRVEEGGMGTEVGRELVEVVLDQRPVVQDGRRMRRSLVDSGGRVGIRVVGGGEGRMVKVGVRMEGEAGVVVRLVSVAARRHSQLAASELSGGMREKKMRTRLLLVPNLPRPIPSTDRPPSGTRPSPPVPHPSYVPSPVHRPRSRLVADFEERKASTDEATTAADRPSPQRQVGAGTHLLPSPLPPPAALLASPPSASSASPPILQQRLRERR